MLGWRRSGRSASSSVITAEERRSLQEADVAARCYRGRDHLVCSFNALGEGAHETLWGIVAGACEVGERAADAALKRLKTN
jgi:hypothetical protein